MKILSINNLGKDRNRDDATFYYRWVVPAKYLRRLGHRCYQLPLAEDKDERFDIIIFNKFFMGDIQYFINYGRRMGAKIVYETDDLQWKPDKNTPFYIENSKQGTINTIIEGSKRLANQVDAITCTTDHLKEEIQKISSKPIFVLPNSVDLEQWSPRKMGNKKLRVGFVGASNHMPHMMMLFEIIKRLKRDYDFDFITKGTQIFDLSNKEDKLVITKEGIKKVVPSFDSLEKTLRFGMKPHLQDADKYYKIAQDINLEEYGWTPNNQFPQSVRDLNLDIGICILDETPFNQCRSALKFYQYAACKTAVISSDTTVYHREGLYTSPNLSHEWYKNLQLLIKNKYFRQQLSEEQYNWVVKNRSTGIVAKIWEKAYQDIIKL